MPSRWAARFTCGSLGPSKGSRHGEGGNLRKAEIDLIHKPPENRILHDPKKQSLDQKSKYAWFHMEKAYAQPDNIQKEHEQEYRRVVGPEEWGTAVASTRPAHTSGHRSALAWANKAATAFPDKFH